MSHVNTDFDALASMVAAKKLYPNAQMVISDKQNLPVRQFLTIYRDTLDIMQDNHIDWSKVTELILVDEASLSRVGNYATHLLENNNLSITLFDHHPPKEGDVEADFSIIEMVGAAVTLLIEEIKQQSLSITPFEANLFGLGLYTDTGSFTYNNTTARDLQAASYLMEQGMDVSIIQRFSDVALLPEQQTLLHTLLQHANTFHKNGLQIIVSTHQQKKFQTGLAIVTEKLLEISDADAVLTVVEMSNRILVVGRASSERITLLPLLERWQGGGHKQAGSAMIKKGDFQQVVKDINEHLYLMIQPAVTANDMMMSPVKTISPDTTLEEAGHLMYRYGHSGFPVVQDEELVGVVTRRDLEKGNHHGLGHAPVKAYMTTNLFTISPTTTEEEIQEIIIKHNIGRLPVVKDKKLVGIVTRTNIIESLHHRHTNEKHQQINQHKTEKNMRELIKKQLTDNNYNILTDIGNMADKMNIPVYLVGGIVRDILLGRENDDIDIVVEGNGVNFSNALKIAYGGEVIVHDQFGTATWTHPLHVEIDITSSRLEYYDRPAALPNVELSTLEEDLQRRDFTINAMAIRLNTKQFGKIVDPFQGQADLQHKRIKVLHNLSFVEDPTRILRGIRFERRFHFSMDEQTEQLAIQSMDKIKQLSTYRILEDIAKIFTENDPTYAIQRLFDLQFWQQFDVSETTAVKSTQHAMKFSELYTTYTTKIEKSDTPHWFSYFIIPFYEDDKEKRMKEFALTKKHVQFLKELSMLKDYQDWDTFESPGDCHLLLKDYSDEAILFYISKHSFKKEEIVTNYIYKRHDLKKFLTGKDLIQQGLQPGSYFSKILLYLDVAILNDEITSKDDAVRWLKAYLQQ